MVDQLAREHGWRRWRWAVIAAAVLAIAAGWAARAAIGDDPLATCDGGSDEIGRVWNAGARRQVGDALARVGTPYARVIADPIAGALADYRDRWSIEHRAACRAYRGGNLEAERFRRRMQCLDRRLDHLASAIDVLAEIDATSIVHAVDVAVRLPPVAPCAELDALADDAEPPAGAGARIQVAAIRQQLSRADALERAGRARDALAIAGGALAAAGRAAYAPALLEAAMAKGRILVLSYEFDAAVAPLAHAEQLAFEQHQLTAAVIAAARRVYAEGMSGGNVERLAGRVDQLVPLSRSLRRDRFAEPLLLNYLGVVAMVRGERERARTSFEAARTALGGADVAGERELSGIDMNLAMLTEQRGPREALARAAWQRFHDRLGPHHLTTLAEQCRYAHYVADPDTALALVRDASALYRSFHPDRVFDRVLCGAFRAALTAELGKLDAAAALYAEVAELAGGARDDDIARRGRLATGWQLLYRGAPAAARDRFASVIPELVDSTAWWDHQLVAEAQLGSGLADDALGRGDRAADQLEAALATLRELIGHNEDVELRQRLALARVSLAGVLRRRGDPQALDRARRLEADAAAFYRAASPVAYRRQLERLAR